MPASSRAWIEHFHDNPSRLPERLWREASALTLEERRAVAASLQEFQLGEGAGGRSFLSRAAAFGARRGDPDLAEAVQTFIREEQRHSALLGRFLDLQQIPRKRKHWVDTIFRRLRKLAGLELASAVLVTAEIVSVPFYEALSRATESALLIALCRELLADEAHHLSFQAWLLLGVRVGRGPLSRLCTSLAHRVLLLGTVLVVWHQHKAVFARAGYDLARLERESLNLFVRLELAIAPIQEQGLALALAQPTVPGTMNL